MSNPKQQSAGTDPHETEETLEEGEIEVLSQDSDEETEAGETDVAGMREIVSALPAMSLRDNFVDDDDDDDEGKKTDIAAAAALLKAALTGKGKKTKEKERPSGSGRRKQGGVVIKVGGASGSGEAPKPKRKAPELTNPPAGEPTCPYCNRKFASWKAAFGHQRAHKGREHRGFLPPPKFTPPSSPRRQTDDPAATASAGGSGAAAGPSGRGIGIDLNAPPAEESGGSSTEAEFDLNKTPPKEDSEDEEKQA